MKNIKQDNREIKIKQTLKEFNNYFNVLGIKKDNRMPIMIALECRLKEMHDMGRLEKVNELNQSL